MNQLQTLAATPLDRRDDAWAEQFLKVLIQDEVSLLTDDPQQGPDGFPYLMLSTDKGGDKFLDIVKWCAEKGVGAAINPNKEQPDFVFPYGMMWNYMLRQEFLSPTPENTGPSGVIAVPDANTLYAGVPSEAYWPSPVRKVFREFLLQQGILKPKALLVSQRKDGPMDLAFSLESIGNPPQEEWQGVLEAFSWFFPRHYSLALVSEKNITGLEFQSF